jgi:hypothetical protein
LNAKRNHIKNQLKAVCVAGTRRRSRRYEIREITRYLEKIL